MDEDRRRVHQAKPQGACLWNYMTQIHELDEDLTPSIGNVTLNISRDEVEEEEDRDRGEDREGRLKLTADSLSDLLVGFRSKR